MKFLILLFLVGCASASFHAALDSHAELLHQDLMNELEEGSLYYAEDETKTEIEEKLKNALDQIVEKIKEAIEKGKTVREDILNKFKELREKMKDMKVDLGNKAKEALKKIRERIRNLLNDLLDNLETKSRRSVDDVEIIEALADNFLKEMFRKLKKEITDRIDKDKLKAKIEEIFGKGNELADSLLRIINEKGEKYKDKLHELIDKYLKPKETEEKRSLREMWEKIKDYFKDLHLDIKEKYGKFGEYVKNKLSKYLEKGKDKMENIRNIAKELKEHIKDVSKEVYEEGMDFLRPYKEDLGALWEQLKDSAKDIVNRKD